MKLRLPPYLGSWTMFCDVAGQIQRVPRTRVLTVAAVGIRTDQVRASRTSLRRLVSGRPLKWKDGGESGAAKILAFLVARQLPAVVIGIHIADLARWNKVFVEGDAFRRKVRGAGASARHLRYIGPVILLRMRLLGAGFATLAGRILRARQPWGDKTGVVDWECVADSDLPEGRAREQFTRALQDWGQRTQELTSIPVEQRVVARTATDDDEPLLLLSDYLAGLYQHADGRVNLGRPVMSADRARLLVARFRAEHGARLFADTEDF